MKGDKLQHGNQHWVSRQAQSLRDAQRRVEGKDRLDSDSAIELAVHQLNDVFGESDALIATSYRYGVIGYFADHVIFMPGFALFSCSKAGMAVAIRAGATDRSRIVNWPAGSEETFSLGAEDAVRTDLDSWAVCIENLAAPIDGLPSTFDISIVSAIPIEDETSFVAAFGVALSDALQGFVDEDLDISDNTIASAFEPAVGFQAAPVYVTAVRGTLADMFALVDSEKCELVNFDVVGEMAVGYIQIPGQPGLDASFVEKRRRDAGACLLRIQERRPSLPSLAHLYHKDLQNIEKSLPRKLRYAVNYLVKENQRVQRAVTAARKGDWQLFGALLFMSNSALTSDWGLQSKGGAFISEMVKEKTTEGLVGARISGDGRHVYVLGQPFSVPVQMDDIRKSYKDHFGTQPRTELL
ncbi:MAG: hypothetical protein HKN43_13700 [Rhodothermales bacterium]|nr:hypothetical protein [Rhodothermales bacterium]